jgi:predicted amidohydrolase
MKRRSFLRQAALGTAAFTAVGRDQVLGRISSKNHDPGMVKEARSDEKSVRIAVVQQDGNPGEVEINRKKALRFAEKALSEQAEIVLFHEELLVGYHRDLHALAEPLNGPTTQAFQELLKGSGSLIIYGLTEKDKESYYVSAPVVSQDGVLANYRKTHLWWKAAGLRHETSYYSPGDKLVTFNYRDHRCGIMICYDGDFPEMTRSYANLGCSMLFWMNNRESRGPEEVKALASANSMIMAVSCCCGKDEEGRLCRGGSNIAGPDGEVVCEIWDQEGLILGDVYPGRVEKLRKENPWYTGLRPELYFYDKRR